MVKNIFEDPTEVDKENCKGTYSKDTLTIMRKIILDLSHYSLGNNTHEISRGKIFRQKLNVHGVFQNM